MSIHKSIRVGRAARAVENSGIYEEYMFDYILDQFYHDPDPELPYLWKARFSEIALKKGLYG